MHADTCVWCARARVCVCVLGVQFCLFHQTEKKKGFDLQSVLSRIHYFRIHDYVQQLAVVQTLPTFLKVHPQVKLVVVDSIAFHFRQNFDDMSLRTRLLNGMAQHLLRLATTHKLAVVLMNQMTTKYVGGSGKMQLAPALGESWGHAATNRVVLCWEDRVRTATLYKSPTMQEATIEYTVTADGIRSVPSNNANDNDDAVDQDDQQHQQHQQYRQNLGQQQHYGGGAAGGGGGGGGYGYEEDTDALAQAAAAAAADDERREAAIQRKRARTDGGSG